METGCGSRLKVLSVLKLLPAATKLGQGNVFTGVCDSVHGRGCLPQCMLGYHTPGSRHPPGADTPWSRHPPGADTVRNRHPQEQTPTTRSRPPHEQTPLGSRHPPTPPEADYDIRSMSGRYTSYWNAFLFSIVTSILI